MRIYLILFYLFINNVSVAQDTLFYDNEWNFSNSFKSCSYYSIVEQDLVDTNRANEKFYFKSHKIKFEKNYSNFKNKTLDGSFKDWYESGQIKKDIFYKDGKLNGKLLTYWENGQPKRIERYENDKLIEGKCFNSDGKESAYYDYSILPVYPGGINSLIQYIANETKYPSKARKKGIEGRVLVGFSVDKNGYVTDVKVINGVSEELNKEAIRVVTNLAKWTPGLLDGERSRFTMHLPITFRINNR